MADAPWTKEQLKTHLTHELKMFNSFSDPSLKEALKNLEGYNSSIPCEIALLHLRNLIEFFFLSSAILNELQPIRPRKTGKMDVVSEAFIDPSHKSGWITFLKSKGTYFGQLYDETCARLTHFSTLRTRPIPSKFIDFYCTVHGWKLTKIRADLSPLFKTFLEMISVSLTDEEITTLLTKQSSFKVMPIQQASLTTSNYVMEGCNCSDHLQNK